MSDIHLEHDRGYQYEDAGEDIILCAGDLGTASAGIRDIAERFIRSTGKPFYYILGNHDFYHGEWASVLAYWKRLKIPNLKFLHNQAVDLGPVILLGTPLFTDFALYGTQAASANWALRCINDFRLISDGSGPSGSTTLKPARYVAEFRKAWKFIDTQLNKAAKTPKPVVVMTHWCPAPEVVSQEYRGDPINPFFTSDCTALIRPPVSLWVHGHSHTYDDRHICGVRVLRHPKGYPSERNKYPPLVVDCAL